MTLIVANLLAPSAVISVFKLLEDFQVVYRTLLNNTGICDGVYISHWSGIHQSNGDASVNPVMGASAKIGLEIRPRLIQL